MPASDSLYSQIDHISNVDPHRHQKLQAQFSLANDGVFNNTVRLYRALYDFGISGPSNYEEVTLMYNIEHAQSYTDEGLLPDTAYCYKCNTLLNGK